MTDEERVRALRTLAAGAGVELEYWDVKGVHHEASVDALLAVLPSLDIEVTTLADAPGALAREQARAAALPASDAVEERATASSGSAGSAPVALGFEATDRLWGVFAPAYALQGGTGIGAHVGTLDALARFVHPRGGRVVATLPLLASYLDEPFDPSPYAPVSRLFWNELYLDLGSLPELAAVPDALDNLEGLRSWGHAANARGRTFDYRHQSGYVRGTLEKVIAGRGSWPTACTEAFARYAEEHPDAVEYARFRARVEVDGTWRSWPESGAAGAARTHPRGLDQVTVDVHLFSQFAMQRRMDALADDLASRDQRLYLDLPVGTHAEGFDTWKHRDLFAWGCAAGAPPDDFFTEGQNWGFPPIKPQVSRASGHAYLREVLRHHMRVAGILRLDHVMGLHRMFWVPDGLEAREGVYVRSPRDELFALVAEESIRSGCVVVGEDLGTVPDEVRDAMAAHGLLGMYVAEFNQPAWQGAPLEAPTNEQLAVVDTHDTPTFSGWLRGRDIDRRKEVGLLDDISALDEYAARRQQRENAIGFLRGRGDLPPGADDADDIAIHTALLRFVGDSDSPCVLVNLEDLWGETEPQNVPGTPVDRPNWVHRYPYEVGELATHDELNAALAALQDCRLGSHLRAAGAGEGS